MDSESRNIIEQTLRRFLADAYDPAARHQRIAGPDIDYRLHWPTLAELGILALPFSEDVGGLSGAATDIAETVRILAAGLVLEPYAEVTAVAGRILAAGLDADRAGAELAAAIAGERVTVLVGGRVAPRDELWCEKAGGEFRLSGRLAVVPFAAQADRWLLCVTDAAGEDRIFFVAPAEISARVVKLRLMDARPAAEIVFEDVRIPEAALWLEGEAARFALREAGLQAVNCHCADAVGTMERLVGETADYLRTRVQFGTNIGAFQALQHRFADMHIGLLESRAVARAFARALDGDDEAEKLRLQRAAALVIERNACLIGHEAIQLHGGMGVTDELIVSHYNARLVVLTRILRAWVPQVGDLQAELPA